MTTAYVYRLFDTDGTLLYVGMTGRPEARIAEHHCRPWFNHVARHTLEEFDTRADASIREMHVIRTEAPLHNVDFAPKPEPADPRPTPVLNAALLRRKRAAAGLTQAQFAELLGVSQASVSLWESGVNEPTMNHYRHMAKALNVAVTELLEQAS